MQPAVRCGVPPWLGSLPDAIRGGSFARAVIWIPWSVNSFIGNPLKHEVWHTKEPCFKTHAQCQTERHYKMLYIQKHTSFFLCVCTWYAIVLMLKVKPLERSLWNDCFYSCITAVGWSHLPSPQNIVLSFQRESKGTSLQINKCHPSAWSLCPGSFYKIFEISILYNLLRSKPLQNESWRTIME